MTRNTPILLDRLASAMAKQGVSLKRTQLLQIAASAFGHRNVHELSASDAEHGPPAARLLGRKRIEGTGWMIFLQDPEGRVFAIDEESFDAEQKRIANWIVSPLGGLVDVSALRSDHAAETLGKAGNIFHTAPAKIDPEVPYYITNACCEAVQVTRRQLDDMNLPHGVFDGDFYPLTDDESRFIAEEVVQSDDGLHHAHIGYSVLYRGRKHVMPTVEIVHETATESGPSQAQAIADATAYADRIRPKVEAIDGHVMLDLDETDRVNVRILVPFSSLSEFSDLEAWKHGLSLLMVDPALPTVQSVPIVQTGRSHQVHVGWYGEGEDGDYNPDAPFDRPLFRFDVKRMANGAWEDFQDASYCVLVPAYCTPEQARQLARVLLDRIECHGSSGMKRLMESLSWTTLRDVRDHFAAEPEPVLHTHEEFVAHVTYGNPERGTSIDLRRRADGSVRCEVYADLDCTALLDADGGMDEVRQWLASLPCDLESADGQPLPSVALAPRWDSIDPESVSWTLVHDGETEDDWFSDTTPNAPFERRFVPISRMEV